MEEQVDELVDKAWELQSQASPSHRTLVSITGIPGSGKTTLATTLVKRLNARFQSEHPAVAPSHGPLAALVGMDGFHLTRRELDQLDDPINAHARRGAPFTFNARAYLSLVRQLREPVTPEMGRVWAPTFDHKVKDPVERGVEVGHGVRVCVFEGNYVGLESTSASSSSPAAGRADAEEQAQKQEISAEEGMGDADEQSDEPATGDECWSAAKALMDYTVLVEVEEDVARRRLVKRHVAAGIAKDEGEAGRRADENDLPNGWEVVKRRGRVDFVVKSREDNTWQ